MEHRPPQSYPMPKRTTKRTQSTLPDLDGLVKAVAAMHGTTRTKVAAIMGMDTSGLLKMLQSRNPKVERLMALSEAVQFNMFDTYLRQLPEHLRATTETRQMAEQMAQLHQEKLALQQELDSVKRERDLLLSLMKGSVK